MPERTPHNWKSHLLILSVAVSVFVLSVLIGMDIVSAESLFGICGFKRTHNIPCPFCGMTRAFIYFFTGKFIASLSVQPAGFLIALFLSMAGVSSAFECLGYKTRFYRNFFYGRRWITTFIGIFLIILISWIYTIFKYRFL
jgi:hypothetical protein